MSKVQKENIDKSTINTASLLEIRKSFDDSVRKINSCIDSLRVSQNELKLEMRSSSEEIVSLNRKQTELNLFVAAMPGLSSKSQSGETNSELYKPTTIDQWELTNQHAGNLTDSYDVRTELKLDTKTGDKAGLDRHIQSSFPPSEMTPTGGCPTSVPNSRHKSHTQDGVTQ